MSGEAILIEDGFGSAAGTRSTIGTGHGRYGVPTWAAWDTAYPRHLFSSRDAP